MDDNTIHNNEEVELNDKETSLSLRTKESLKSEFKSIEGKTDNEKLVKLLELHRSFQDKQDLFNIDSYMESIDKSLENIHIQFNAVTKAVNQEHENMISKYIVGVSEELKSIKVEIENEEVISARTVKLEKDIELLQRRFDEKEKIVNLYKEKVINLESERNDLLTINNSFVSKENEYINQLREKDYIISFKDNDTNKLSSEYDKELKIIEDDYKSKLEELKLDSSDAIKKFKDDLVLVDKEKAVLENNISYLTKENSELKSTIKSIKSEYKQEIKDLEKYNNLISIDNAKLEAKIENLEKQIEDLRKI